jgi:hypothetical protein
MSSRREEAGDLSKAVSLFLKVTKSYWKGLFHSYRFPEGTLPRTNNDLEHCFGSVRATESDGPAAGKEPRLLWWSEAACA